jgi:hypothetical protein
MLSSKHLCLYVLILKNASSYIQVWMDIDQMEGSLPQAMAEAVEGAEVFLICISNKYKHSSACRAGKQLYVFQTI